MINALHIPRLSAEEAPFLIKPGGFMEGIYKKKTYL
jgi:hypothetical protein